MWNIPVHLFTSTSCRMPFPVSPCWGWRQGNNACRGISRRKRYSWGARACRVSPLKCSPITGSGLECQQYLKISWQGLEEEVETLVCVRGRLVSTVDVREFSRLWAGDPAVPLTLSESLPPRPFLGHLEELKIEEVGMALCSDEQC